jgi:hypothetical protein
MVHTSLKSFGGSPSPPAPSKVDRLRSPSQTTQQWRARRLSQGRVAAMDAPRLEAALSKPWASDLAYNTGAIGSR